MNKIFYILITFLFISKCTAPQWLDTSRGIFGSGEKIITDDKIGGKIIFEDNEGREKIIFCELNYDKNKMYLDMMKRFYKLAKGDLKPLITVEEATKVVSLVESMKLSSFQRKVISLAGDN